MQPIEPIEHAERTNDTDVAIPPVPVLAPGVRPAGELKDNSFQERQWLVERGRGFVQVTELLYRVLEAVDGRRTLEQVAAAVSAATGSALLPEDVEQLVETKLRPAGLVLLQQLLRPTPRASGAAGRRYTHTALGPLRSASGFTRLRAALTPIEAPAAAVQRSLLGVRLRLVVLGPRLIDPLTGALQHLYSPPLLQALLAATAASRAWLYLAHGVAGGMHQVLYTPGLALAVVALLLLSAICHEFGHAAALRYGGGRVRGMGAGFYLAYPALFTDVTDGYRLGRWARVRTDLGGFYFNLLFSLTVMALYRATGWEFLLLVVALIDLEIVHQLLPLVRLDGYWLLADLTGLPDFLSLVGPYLRSILPGSRWKGARLPALKPWARLVLGVYVAVVLPLLALLLFAAVRGLPHALAIAADALREQRTTLAAAWIGRNVLGAAVALLHVVTLTLPAAGLLLFLATLARRVAVVLWRWSQPAPARRAVAALATVCAATLLAVLWTPQTTLARVLRERAVRPLEAAGDTTPVTRADVPEAAGQGGAPSPSPTQTPTPTPPTTTPLAASPAPTGQDVAPPAVPPTQLPVQPVQHVPTAVPTRAAAPAPSRTAAGSQPTAPPKPTTAPIATASAVAVSTAFREPTAQTTSGVPTVPVAPTTPADPPSQAAPTVTRLAPTRAATALATTAPAASVTVTVTQPSPTAAVSTAVSTLAVGATRTTSSSSTTSASPAAGTTLAPTSTLGPTLVPANTPTTTR